MSTILIITSVTIIGMFAKIFLWKLFKNNVMYEVNSLVLNFVFSLVDAYSRKHNKLENPQKRQDHVAIVTGGGRGIGPEIAKILMKNGMNVIIAIRNPNQCEDVMKQMRKDCPEGKVSAMALDVSSMKSVRDFCKSFLGQYSKLHVLVNNAGIYFGGFKLTEDGFEEKLATNHLGHCLLTHLLMDTLEKSAKDCEFYSRVVHVSSCYHFNAVIDFENINLKEDYGEGKSYAQSKLAQLMFSRALDRLLEKDNSKVRSYAVHPGMVSTDMFKTGMAMLGPFFVGLTKYVKNPEEGGISVAFACLSPTLEKKGGGKYLTNCMDATSSGFSQSKDYQDKLLKLSMDMLKIEKFGAIDQRVSSKE